MLISEKIFLLLTTDEGTTEPWVTRRNFALAAALLADLAISGDVTFEGESKDPYIQVSPAGSSGTHHPVLEFGLEALSSRPRFRGSTLIAATWFSPKTIVARHLADSGVLTVEKSKLMGLIPERYPTLDAGPESTVRSRLSAVLAGALQPSADDALVLALLQEIGAAERVLKEERGHLAGATLKSRIDEITKSIGDADSTLPALKHAIDSLQAVILGAAVGSVF